MNTGTGSKILCAQCELPESSCDCEKYCCLCQSVIDIRVCDGHDLDSMRDALAPGRGKPLLVVLNTVKGHGVREIEGRMESHYLPLTAEQYANAMASFEVAI